MRKLLYFFWAPSMRAPHAKQPKVGEPLVYGVPRKVPGPNICCRRWTVELILVIMRVREAMLATKSGLIMLRILQIIV